MDTRVTAPTKRKVRQSPSVVEKLPAQAKPPEQRAEVELKKAAASAGALVKKHPAVTAVTAGALVGAGVLVGVVAQRAFHHEPTVGEAVMGALKRSASKVSKRLSSTAAAGLSAGKATAKRALR
jgi:hypothetical protein